MKTLISQKDFANKVGISPSQLSRDFVKTERLPMDGRKIIMPDAEKIFYSYLSGSPRYLERGGDQQQRKLCNVLAWTYKDGSEGEIAPDKNKFNITIPDEKQITLQCEDLEISLYKADDGDLVSGLSFENFNISLATNRRQRSVHTLIDLKVDDYFSIAIVNDNEKAEVIDELGGLLKDPDNNCYLLTKSELMVLIKSKFVGDKRYL